MYQALVYQQVLVLYNTDHALVDCKSQRHVVRENILFYLYKLLLFFSLVDAECFKDRVKFVSNGNLGLLILPLASFFLDLMNFFLFSNFVPSPPLTVNSFFLVNSFE